MQETNLELRALAARFDALLPALERFLARRAVRRSQSFSPASANDDWDDSPEGVGHAVRRAATACRYCATHRRTRRRPPSLSQNRRRPTRRACGRLDSDGNLDQRFPRQYRITVEDKRRGVDLVPLHRAIQGMQNVKDMSLLSYSNGVAIVALETIGGIDPDVLGAAVARAMSRETQGGSAQRADDGREDRRRSRERHGP